LQIVLIIFVLFTFVLTLLYSHIANQAHIYQNILLLEQQKNLEIVLIHYYQKTLKDDILLSDDYEDEYVSIRYEVETEDTNYLITTEINIFNIEYSFICEIETENYQVIHFEYRKEPI